MEQRIVMLTLFLFCSCGSRFGAEFERQEAAISAKARLGPNRESNAFENSKIVHSTKKDSVDAGVDAGPNKEKEESASDNKVSLGKEATIIIGNSGRCIPSDRGGGICSLQLLRRRPVRTSGVVALKIKNTSNKTYRYSDSMQCRHVFFLFDGVNDKKQVIGPCFGNIFEHRTVDPGETYTIIADIRIGNESWIDLEEGKYKVKICIGGPHICVDKKVEIDYRRGEPVPEEYRDRYKRCEQLCPDDWPNRCADFQ
jgi:hypothetical protein